MLEHIATILPSALLGLISLVLGHLLKQKSKKEEKTENILEYLKNKVYELELRIAVQETKSSTIKDDISEIKNAIAKIVEYISKK